MASRSPWTWLKKPLASSTQARSAKYRVKSRPPVVAWLGRKETDGSEIQRWVEVTIPPRLVLPLSQSLCRRPTV